MNDRQTRIYEFGRFRLDAGRRLLTREGSGVVPLSPKLFDTLWHLVIRRGAIVGKDELMAAVWSDTIVEENNLNKNISRLRQVLGERLGENQFIATIPGKGYQFVGEVRQVDDAEPPAQTEPEAEASFHPNPQGAADSGRTGRFWLLASVIAFALGLSAWAIYAGSVNVARPADPVRSVAVLPFKPLDSEARHESLELGMADALIARLGGIEELAVRPLSSVRRYASVNQDSLAVCRALNTDAVLHQWMALLSIERGMYDDAAASGRKAVEASGGNAWAKGLEGYALAKSGKTAAARAALAEIVQRPDAPGFRPYPAALVCAGLGDTDQALMWLERGVEQRDPGMTFLKVDEGRQEMGPPQVRPEVQSPDDADEPRLTSSLQA